MVSIESNNKRIYDIDEELKKYDINRQSDNYNIMRLGAEKRVRLVLRKILSSQVLNNDEIVVLAKLFDAKDRYDQRANSPEFEEGGPTFYILNGWIIGKYSPEEIELLNKVYSSYIGMRVNAQSLTFGEEGSLKKK